MSNGHRRNDLSVWNLLISMVLAFPLFKCWVSHSKTKILYSGIQARKGLGLPNHLIRNHLQWQGKQNNHSQKRHRVLVSYSEHGNSTPELDQSVMLLLGVVFCLVFSQWIWLPYVHCPQSPINFHNTRSCTRAWVGTCICPDEAQILTLL